VIPSSDWRTKYIYPHELEQWVNLQQPNASFCDLWEGNIDPQWLPHLAVVGGATREHIVVATCAVARLCMSLIPENKSCLRVAVETAEAWARGEATAEQVQLASNGAYITYASYDQSPSSAAARAFHYAAATATVAVATSELATAEQVEETAGAYNPNSSSAVYWVLRAGIESQVVCATLRKYLPFERPPRPKGLTTWQRLAILED